MMLDVARKKHCRHTATAELALDGVRGAKAGLELLTQQFWHQQIDESPTNRICTVRARTRLRRRGGRQQSRWHVQDRSEEHTSELQSRGHLVCRLLLEKKKRKLI